MSEIFVFGSNLSGIHGAGSARHAFEAHGAHWGQGFGLSGVSFAIPTKDWDIEGMTIDRIRPYVRDFIAYAEARPQLKFRVVAIGCGLAGLQHADMAPLFAGAPKNCYFDPAWTPFGLQPWED